MIDENVVALAGAVVVASVVASVVALTVAAAVGVVAHIDIKMTDGWIEKQSDKRTDIIFYA